MSTSAKHQSGSVKIHNPKLYSELLGKVPKQEEEAVDHNESLTMSPPASPRRQCGSSPVRVPSRSSTAQMTRIEDWLSRKARRAVVSLPDDPELTVLKELCQTIREQEEAFLEEIDSFLTIEEERQQCKKEILYQKWHERVFLPVQTKLALQMASEDYHSLDREKRALFDQYLSYKNKKQVFLDTISPDAYNPLERGNSLVVRTRVLDDPLISQRTDHNSEKMILQGCDQGIPLPEAPHTPCNGREDTDPVLWLAMQLVHIDSEARKKSKNRMSHDHNSESRKQEGSEKDLNIPHKRQICYPREKFELTWDEQAKQ